MTEPHGGRAASAPPLGPRADVALLVCSNGTHVRMLGPVADELARRGWATRFVGLDEWGLPGARAEAAAAGRSIEALRRPGGRLGVPFARRPAPIVWRDVLRAEAPVRDLLRPAPRAVVTGNDRGLLEKLVIRRAREAGSATVVIQDGAIAATRPPPRGVVERLQRLARRLGSAGLGAMGLAHLGASLYGQGGADVVCATGTASARVLEALGVPSSRIVVTGQPRYDTLRPPDAGRDPGGARDTVVWLTTPFVAHGQGRREQEEQARLVAEVATSLADAGIPFVVRPHPDEDADVYARDGLPVGERAVPLADTLLTARATIVGISTAVEEAMIASVPVLVPGARVHGGRFESMLPPAGDFPRFESGAELVRLVESLRGEARAELAARQRTSLADRISIDPDRSAAVRVADVIERVAGR